MRGSDRVHFHQLNILRRENDYVVSYEHTNSHVIVDEEGKNIIQDLHTHTIEEVQKKHEGYNVEEFIEQLQKNGLVHKINHRVINHQKHVADIITIPKKYANFFVHPVVVGVLLGVIATGIYLLITQPTLIPTPKWLFATDTLTLLIPLIVLTYFAISFVHELGHHIMMQILGYSRAVALEHRWFFLRPKADLTTIHTLKETAKTDVKLAGIITDLLILSKALIVIALTQNPLAQLVALLVFVHLLGQTLMHPAADLHFSEEKTGCILCRLFTPKNFIGVLSLAIIVFAYTIPAVQELVVKTITAAQDPLTHIDGVIALTLLTATLTFAAAANLYDHQYNTNKAYQSIMISALATALLLTTLLIGSLIAG
ncbi:MAG: hypothetical protein ACMXYD_04730 [Candidatus Woesearchaeota archaeon]